MTYVKNIENELIQNIPQAADLLNDIYQSIAERAFINCYGSQSKTTWPAISAPN